MNKPRLGPALLVFLLFFGFNACSKRFNLETESVPGNTLVLEFSDKVKYVIDLQIDGKSVPLKYGRNNRLLWVEGLKPGKHNFNIDSVSYVFGPEFEYFEVSENKGAYFFVQSRKYRSAIPKDRARVSIRAYRKKLKREGVDINKLEAGTVRGAFR